MTDNVIIHLCDPDGKALIWDNIGPIKATILDLSVENPQACPRDLTRQQNKRQAIGQLRIEPLRFFQIRVQAGPDKDGNSREFDPVMATVDCDGPPLDIHMRASQAPAGVPPRQRATSLTIRALWCAKKARHRQLVHAAEIVSATAELMPDAARRAPRPGIAQPQVLHANVHGGNAVFTFPGPGKYAIDVRLKEKYARCALGMPFYLSVGWGSDRDLPIYFEPYVRVVALFFVDLGGQPVDPPDVFLESTGKPLTHNGAGIYTLLGAEKGLVKLLSSSFDLEPRQIYVDERMAQGFVIEAIPKAAAAKALPAPDPDDFVLEFEKLPSGRALVEVITPAGEVVATLTPDPKGQVVYPGKPNDEFDFVARVDGTVLERIRMKSK
jgi:hypothetical protein